MARETFNRVEKKYCITREQFEGVKDIIRQNLQCDVHNLDGNTYGISNIYYDTANSDLIRQSLFRPTYKEKLRLRAYGAVEEDSRVYVEIKKKVGGVVNKRRSALALGEAYLFLSTGQIPPPQEYHNTQALREVEYMLAQNAVHPAVVLCYDRIAYCVAPGSNKDGLRISFDFNIRARRDTLRLEAGSHGSLILPADTVLMEIKVPDSYPLWLARLLAEHKIAPNSFSKYGTEYQLWLRKNKLEG